MGGKTPTIDGPIAACATRSGSSTGAQAAALPPCRRQPARRWGPGEHLYLTRGGSQYATGLSVGVVFTPTGCLTASAGFGAEPREFNLAAEAN